MPIAKKGQQKISILNKTTVPQCFVLLGIISLWHYHNQHAELIEVCSETTNKVCSQIIRKATSETATNTDAVYANAGCVIIRIHLRIYYANLIVSKK